MSTLDKVIYFLFGGLGPAPRPPRWSQRPQSSPRGYSPAQPNSNAPAPPADETRLSDKK